MGGGGGGGGGGGATASEEVDFQHGLVILMRRESDCNRSSALSAWPAYSKRLIEIETALSAWPGYSKDMRR